MKFWFNRLLRVVIVLVMIFGSVSLFFYSQFTPSSQVTWGLSYSPGQAAYLGLDPHRTYTQLLNDLHPQRLRLMAYWNEIEPQQDKFDFAMMDWMLKEAQDHGAQVLLAVGRKQPRWPECHEPGWFDALSSNQQRDALMNMLAQTINHFKTQPIVYAWQVENEPFFDYGQDCPTISKEQLQSEIELVKSLDSRPVVVTDSGEKGAWFGAARLADILGVTMYREVYHTGYKSYIRYPFPPAYYRIHAGLVKVIARQTNMIGVELQAEPWFQTDVFHTDVARQKELMNPEIFKQNVAYAERVGFAENYLWGVCWWYWLQEKQNDTSMVEAAKQLFNNP